MALEDLRAAIDALDVEIVDLLARRFSIVDRVAAHKAAAGIPMMSQERVVAVREHAEALARERGLDVARIGRIYELLVAETCEYEDGRIRENLAAGVRPAG